MSSDLSEIELIQLLKNQSLTAFGLLHKRYAHTIEYAISKVIKDENDVQDIVQDTLIKVWENATNFNPEKGSLAAWLLTVARHTAIDYLRQQRKQLLVNQIALELDFHLVHPDEGPALPPYELIEQSINALEPKYSQLIQLLYFQNLTQQQIAEQLDIPLGTVKTRIRTALLQLRKDVLRRKNPITMNRLRFLWY